MSSSKVRAKLSHVLKTYVVSVGTAKSRLTLEGRVQLHASAALTLVPFGRETVWTLHAVVKSERGVLGVNSDFRVSHPESSHCVLLTEVQSWGA